MSEGLSLAALHAQEQLTSSIDRLTAEVKNASDSADATSSALARYTKWLAVATVLLFVATAALVLIEAMHKPVEPAATSSTAP